MTTRFLPPHTLEALSANYGACGYEIVLVGSEPLVCPREWATHFLLGFVSDSRYLSAHFQYQGLLILFLIVCLQWISQHLTI